MKDIVKCFVWLGVCFLVIAGFLPPSDRLTNITSVIGVLAIIGYVWTSKD